MTCYLRILGKELDLKQCLSALNKFDGVTSFVRGEPRNAVSKVLNEFSGVVVQVSEIGFDHFDEMINDAVRFLDDNAFEVRSAAASQGVEVAVLDFGVKLTDDPVHFWRFSPDLTVAAGRLGIALELSVYWPDRPRSGG